MMGNCFRVRGKGPVRVKFMVCNEPMDLVVSRCGHFPRKLDNVFILMNGLGGGRDDILYAENLTR